jgi:hypothetical protein
VIALSPAQETSIENVIEGIPFLSFNRTEATFDISDEVSDPSWGQVQLVLGAVRRIRPECLPFPPLQAVRVDSLATGYFDRCLERYCYERLRLGIPHEQTCWGRHARKVYCVGKIDPGTDFDDRAKARFMESLGRERRQDIPAMSIYKAYCRDPLVRRALRMDAEGWLMFHLGDIPLRPLGRLRRFGALTKAFVKKVLKYREDDRVLRVVRSIEAHGWHDGPAGRDGGVLGYSRATGRHFVIVGKHRIAALKYLYSQGKIDGSTLVHFPVITYPWGQWLRGRLYPGAFLCERCEWRTSAWGAGQTAAAQL